MRSPDGWNRKALQNTFLNYAVNVRSLSSEFDNFNAPAPVVRRETRHASRAPRNKTDAAQPVLAGLQGHIDASGICFANDTGRRSCAARLQYAVAALVNPATYMVAGL